MVKRKRVKERGEGGNTEGKERTEEVQTGVRPLQGAGGQQGERGWGSRGTGKEGGVAVVAMETTRNVPVAPGCPHRLMGPKPRPVPHNCLSQVPRTKMSSGMPTGSGMSERS